MDDIKAKVLSQLVDIPSGVCKTITVTKPNIPPRPDFHYSVMFEWESGGWLSVCAGEGGELHPGLIEDLNDRITNG